MMKQRFLLKFGTFVFCALLAAVPAIATVQEKPKDTQPQPTADEAKLLTKMNSAPNALEKTKGGVEFIKKFKKTTMRPKVVEFLTNNITSEKDPNVRMQAAQLFVSNFDQPGEADGVRPAIIETYIQQNKFDEAYAEGAKYLEKNPDDVFVLALLGWNGANLIQKQGANWKYAAAATTYAHKSAELLEQDKKPEKTDAKFWADYRNAWLPRIYQAQGFMAYFGNDKPKAKEHLEKAVGFEPYDFNTLAMLADINGNEYQQLAQKYQTEKKSAILDQALAKMDETIDWLARAVAAAEGKPELQANAKLMLENLQQYYGFRHENKMDGLQPLINKYKKPAN